MIDAPDEVGVVVVVVVEDGEAGEAALPPQASGRATAIDTTGTRNIARRRRTARSSSALSAVERGQRPHVNASGGVFEMRVVAGDEAQRADQRFAGGVVDPYVE